MVILEIPKREAVMEKITLKNQIDQKGSIFFYAPGSPPKDEVMEFSPPGVFILR